MQVSYGCFWGLSGALSHNSFTFFNFGSQKRIDCAVHRLIYDAILFPDKKAAAAAAPTTATAGQQLEEEEEDDDEDEDEDEAKRFSPNENVSPFSVVPNDAVVQCLSNVNSYFIPFEST